MATTSTAVNDGRPPSFSAMPIATGAVTDFGASESCVSTLPPSSAAMATALRAATVTPTTTATATGSHSRRRRPS